MSKKIDILALPKGVRLRCEVCRKVAVDRCLQCLVTFYCTEEHKQLDWDSIHRVICSELKVVRGPQPFPVQQQQRQIAEEVLRKKKSDIQKKAEMVAKDMILRCHPDLALPAAMQALVFAVELSGKENPEVIEPFLLLAEANLDLENVEKAYEYICQAEWVHQKSEKAPLKVHIDVQRIIGLVNLQRGDIETAKEAFAEAIYYLSEEFGTSSTKTASAFCHMGLALRKGMNYPGVQACFKKASEIWFFYLLNLYIRNDLNQPTEYEMENKEIRENEWMLLEARTLFKQVFNCCKRLVTTDELNCIVFKTCVCLAIFAIRFKNAAEREKFSVHALEAGVNTRQTNVVPEDQHKYVMEILGDDYLYLYDRKHNRPRTIATKYLEKVKEL